MCITGLPKVKKNPAVVEKIMCGKSKKY